MDKTICCRSLLNDNCNCESCCYDRHLKAISRRIKELQNERIAFLIANGKPVNDVYYHH